MKIVTNVQLGGADRSLLFGVGGFYDHIWRQTGKQPLEWIMDLPKRDGKTEIDSIDEVAVIVYAGVNAFMDDKDKDNVGYEKVRKWVNGLDTETMTSICNDAFNALANSIPSEGEIQARATVSQQNGVS